MVERKARGSDRTFLFTPAWVCGPDTHCQLVQCSELVIASKCRCRKRSEAVSNEWSQILSFNRTKMDETFASMFCSTGCFKYLLEVFASKI